MDNIWIEPTEQCPVCGELVYEDEIECPNCGYFLGY